LERGFAEDVNAALKLIKNLSILWNTVNSYPVKWRGGKNENRMLINKKKAAGRNNSPGSGS
jgi:hypothetical protein